MLRVETALSQKLIEGIVILCFENERPPQGLLGYLDWRLGGPFTKLIKSQALTGQAGESVYLPLKWNDETIHILLLGAGSGSRDGSHLKQAIEKMSSLKAGSFGIGASDFALKPDQAYPDLEVRNIWVLN